MFKNSFSFALLTAFFLFNGSLSVQAQDLKIYTEEWPYNNYTDEAGAPAGSSTAIVNKVAENAGVTISVEMIPWARGYNAVETEANNCIFSTMVTEERLPLFKWVKPISQTSGSLYVKHGRKGELAIESLEDVKTKGLSIGVYNQDVYHLMLEKQGGYNLSVVDDDETNARMLQGGRLDVWFTTGESALSYKKANPGFTYEKITDVETHDLGLACNIDSDAELIDKMQSALDELIASGEAKKIIEAEKVKYLE